MIPSRAFLLAGAVCLLTLALGAAFMRLAEARRIERQREEARQAGDVEARSIEKQLDRVLSPPRSLALIIQNGGEIRNFDAVAAGILKSYPEIRSLQLAPGGVVRQTYPPQRPGSDPDPSSAEIAEHTRLPRAVLSRELALEGPFTRDLDGSTLVGRLPVFVTDEAGSRRPWGSVIEVIGLEDLLRGSRLDRLVAQGYDYKLSRVEARGRRAATFARSTENELRHPVELEIIVPGGSWILLLEPRAGWRSPISLAAGLILVLVISMIASLSSYELLRQPERLRQEVQVRSRRLSETHRQLSEEITRREQVEQTMRREAFQDPLTGLPNRASLMGRLERALERARETPGCEVAVFLLDVDHFNAVNDRLGNSFGDRLLVALGRRLESVLREEEEVARIGGNEFAILVCGVKDADAATRIATWLQEELKLPFTLDREELGVSASIGIAWSPTGHDRAEDLLRDADIALHHARALGGACHVVFREEMHAQQLEVMHLELDLRRAVERDEFLTFYQPIVSLRTGTITALEALVRWQHPSRGLVGPAEFISVAERTGLILPMSRRILLDAVRQIHAWHGKYSFDPKLSVSMNVSGKNFNEPDLVPFVEHALQEAGLEPHSLTLEITESVMMESIELAVDILSRLKELGVRLSLDDFGTGYSSLAHIHRFPLDTVKIDRSFVWRISTDRKTLEVVRSVLALCRELGIQVTAEGIETPEQLSQLRELGCGYGQGFLFAKPLDARAAELLLVSNPRW